MPVNALLECLVAKELPSSQHIEDDFKATTDQFLQHWNVEYVLWIEDRGYV